MSSAARNSRTVLLGALLLWGSLSNAQAPPAYVPKADSTVLARVPRTYAAWRDGALRIDSPEALGQALADIARGGDARLVGRLQSALDALPAGVPRPDAELAQIWIAQHQHDFAAARAGLDDMLARDPRNAGAIAMRAHLNLTQGRLRDAQRDCGALLLLDPRQAGLCAARLAQRRGNTEAAGRVLGRLGEGDDGVARDARLLAAEVASIRGDAAAGELFRSAMSAAPGDVRPRIALARWLRRHGRAAEALALLPVDSDHDGIALERVLAAYASGAADASVLRQRLEARHAAARAAGSSPETRDEAELALLAGDAAHALQLALANFETQRDIEDIDLLERAAHAARRPAALAPLAAWAAAEGASVPATAVDGA